MTRFPKPAIGWPTFSAMSIAALAILAAVFRSAPTGTIYIPAITGFALGLAVVKLARFE